MQEVLNTLYVTTEHAYLRLDHDTLRMEVEKETTFRMPLLHLRSIVCFGNILLSPALIHRCSEEGRSIVFLDQNGRFKARLEGPTTGNVLLRRAQHEALTETLHTLCIARNIVVGKLQNSRQVLLRAMREADQTEDAELLALSAKRIGMSIERLEHSKTLDEVRGYEGEAAHAYFQVFNQMVRREDRDDFTFSGRTRRPPQDCMNALLSFLYTLLRSDCVGALESVGLDPQMGYLHTLRPGRPALALDIMEEFRALLADRLAISLVNRHQIRRADFQERAGGAIFLTDTARKAVIVAYQRRKQDVLHHRVAEKKVPLGIIPFLQARLLARHLRGDLPEYLPFLFR